MNEDAGLPHLSGGLRLDLMTQRNANFDSNVPLPGLGLPPRLEREDDEATMAASPKNPHDVSDLAR
eukprot:6008407-Amphidinium_carterae.1